MHEAVHTVDLPVDEKKTGGAAGGQDRAEVFLHKKVSLGPSNARDRLVKTVVWGDER